MDIFRSVCCVWEWLRAKYSSFSHSFGHKLQFMFMFMFLFLFVYQIETIVFSVRGNSNRNHETQKWFDIMYIWFLYNI